ncbi:response regulator transcription factor [Colwelliaceae bacterium BS250]
MSISKNTLDWHSCLATVIDKNFNSEAINELIKGLENLLGGRSTMFTVYPYGLQPQTTNHRVLADENPVTQIDTYDSGAYLLDPFYRLASHDKVEGPFTMTEIAPEGFEESEYFDLFYKRLGFNDELCIIFQLKDKAFASISLARHSTEKPFSQIEIEQVKQVFPLLKSIIEKWRQYTTKPSNANLEWQLDNALLKFGSSILTARECQILHLVLHGYSVKYIAEKLENSVETIKHHRKNIYMKLDVSSQSELFYLFIASLKAMPEGGTEDPLTFME